MCGRRASSGDSTNSQTYSIKSSSLSSLSLKRGKAVNGSRRWWLRVILFPAFTDTWNCHLVEWYEKNHLAISHYFIIIPINPAPSPREIKLNVRRKVSYYREDKRAINFAIKNWQSYKLPHGYTDVARIVSSFSSVVLLLLYGTRITHALTRENTVNRDCAHSNQQNTTIVGYFARHFGTLIAHFIILREDITLLRILRISYDAMNHPCDTFRIIHLSNKSRKINVLFLL